MAFHKNSSIGSNHIIHQWEYADATARTGATGFVASDIGKVAKQLDTLDLYQLITTTPTWRHIGTGGTPASHNTTHQSGGSDAIKLDDLATPDDNTDLNASASRHGLLPKLSGSATDVLKGDGSWGAGGGSSPNIIIPLPATSWTDCPVEKDTGTNGGIYGLLLDDAYANVGEAIFKIPADIGTGDVTFYAEGYASTAVASRVIQLRVSHSAKTNSESWDASYATKDSGNINIDATQDDYTFASWTETVANLGWSAGDIVRIKINRIAPASGTDLSGNFRLVHFQISIPRA